MSYLQQLSIIVILLTSRSTFAQLDFEQEPILYSSAIATDPVARLNKEDQVGRCFSRVGTAARLLEVTYGGIDGAGIQSGSGVF